jgi:hypothetical protein
MAPPRAQDVVELALALVLALLGGGCQDNVATPFPPGLEPFADGDVPGELPAPDGEALETQTSSDGMIRVYGRGRVLAPPGAVWTAEQVPEAMVARCNTSRHAVTPDTEPEHALSFLVHYVVDDVLTVEWDDQWRGDVVTGTADAPSLAMVKHQKIQGSDFIYLSEGSILLRATEDPDATELWFVEHLRAISGSIDQVVRGMRDNYDALVALVHDQMIPPCP